MDVPPPRYRVIERGRRLEVIDTRAPASPVVKARRMMPERVAFDGTREWTTHPLYDERGPRRVRVDGAVVRGAAGVAGLAIAALIVALVAVGFTALVPVAILVAVAVQNGRGVTTKWLDARVVKGG